MNHRRKTRSRNCDFRTDVLHGASRPELFFLQWDHFTAVLLFRAPCAVNGLIDKTGQVYMFDIFRKC